MHALVYPSLRRSLSGLACALALAFAVPALPAATIEYQGLTNSSVGNADVYEPDSSLGTPSTALYVTNLGSGGQDGLAISLPAGFAALTVAFQPLDNSNTLPVGAYLQEQMVAAATGGTASVLGTATVTKAGTSNYLLSADFSGAGAKTYTVQAYFQGVLVGQAMGTNGSTKFGCPLWPPAADVWDPLFNMGQDHALSWEWTNAVAIAIGPAILNVDHLYFAPNNVTLSTAPTALQILAAQVPGFTIASENVGLTYQGRLVSSVGAAYIYEPDTSLGTPSTLSALYVTNLGSSGQDGVSFALPGNLTALTVNYQPLDVSNTLPVGAYVQEQIGGAGRVLGTATVTKAGTTNYLISADFSGAGTSNYTVQAYFQGVLVGQATGTNGAPLVGGALWPPAADIYDPLFNMGEDHWLSWEWTNWTAISIGTTLVNVDHLYFTPNNVTLSNAPTSWQLTASQVPDITLTSASASLLYQGLVNTALGNSSVAVSGSAFVVDDPQDGVVDDPQDGVVDDPQDGFSITLPAGVASLTVNYEQLDASNSLPVGAFVQEQMVGAGTGTSAGATALGAATVTKAGMGNYLFSADFSGAGAITYTVRAYLQGVLVGTATGTNGSSLVGGALWPPAADIWDPLFNMGQDHWLSWEWTNAIALTIGTAVLNVDHLYFAPNNVTLSTAPTVFQITSGQVPGFTITSENEGLTYQGRLATSLGAAEIYEPDTSLGTPSTLSSLYVTNLGSSGQDGVSVSLPTNLVALTVDYQSLDASNSLPVGAYVQEQMTGAGGILGTATVTKAGTGNYLFSADFSGAGATIYTVQAYFQGALVAQATGTNGAPLVGGALWPPAADIYDPLFNMGQDHWLSWEWTNWTAVSIAGSFVNVDHLYFTPNKVILGTAPTAWQITASQVPVITLTSANASLLYQGLVNTSLGNSALTTSGSELVVDNPQDGVVDDPQDGVVDDPQDGFAITLPAGVTGLTVSYDQLDVSNTLPAGAFVQAQLIGTGTGTGTGAASAFGAATVTKAGTSNYVISADFSGSGATTYTVQAYLQGVLVAQATGTNGAPLVGGAVGWPQEMDTWIPIINPGAPIPVRYVSMDFTSAEALTIGTTIINADHLDFSPNKVTPTGTPMTFLITSGQVPGFTITGENASVAYGGFNVTSLGSSALSASAGGIYVTNLGSDGQDGVSFALPTNAVGLVVNYQPLDVSNSLPIGAYVQEAVVGTANGNTNGVLGTSTVTKAGTTNYLISANFSAAGANTFVMQAYLQGVLVGQATGTNGSTKVGCPLWPPAADIYDPLFNMGKDHWLSWDWTLPVALSVGTTVVTADQLFFTPAKVVLGSAPTAFQLTASQVPSINLTGATVSPSLVSASSSAQSLTLQWLGTGVLQTSSDLVNWSTVTGANSPYTVSMTGTNQYFRVMQPTP